MKRIILLSAFAVMFVPPLVAVSQTASSAPTPAAASAPTVVPALVPYSGVALNAEGKPLSGESSITFLIFKDQQGGEPLFTETQAVGFDSEGHYKVQLGAVSPNGLPAEVFSTGEARWLEIQIAGQPPQQRILLASVPYAMKAADAATLGGLPASAYALAGSSKAAIANRAANGVQPDIVSNVTTTGGTAGYVPEFSGLSSIVNSPIFALGTKVGIGTTTPTSSLNVVGNTVLNGGLAVVGNSFYEGPAVVFPIGTATATTGYNSQPFKLNGSAYNSSSKSAVTQHFQWQVEVLGNNTTSPSATLNLLASTTSAAPAETGFHFNADGTMQFAKKQTFGASALLSAATNVFTGSNATVGNTEVDFNNLNTGSLSPGVLFGAPGTGEGISSQRVPSSFGNGGNVGGLDLYTLSTPRISITNAGLVGIGTTNPQFNLDVSGSGNVSGNFSAFSYVPSGVGTISLNGPVSVNADIPMTHNPRMSFSGFLKDNLGSAPNGGFFVPDQNIVITRILGNAFNSASEQDYGHDCTGLAQIAIFANGGTTPIAVLSLPNLATGFDSGAGTLSVPVSAGTQLVIGSVGASGCNDVTFGQSPQNVFVNVEYAMQ
jgi:hypothetical protein